MYYKGIETVDMKSLNLILKWYHVLNNINCKSSNMKT